MFRRGDDYRVVYMNRHACDKNYQYHQAAQKLVRKVKGYGKTTLSGILRVWFENGTDGNWHYEPTICIQVAGKPVEARIPMPAYK